ncbi:amidase [Microbaculum marinum]|uniref:Indoleacetamide hydrolase n=1 Tax=Microbaculum marinum TaxID=1764581 RepID=A0AAW9S1V7_9HYPH
MTDDEYVTLTAAEIAGEVAAGRVSARAVTDLALTRIEATEPEANAFILVDADGARAAAGEVDRRLAAGEPVGPLAGVPVSVKDLTHVAGMPTSFGSKAYAGTPAPADAIPVARLRAADAVIVGKTTTPEFGHKAITQSPLFGRTLNPFNRDYTSGGSSGGAGVSVAARQVPIALGTDGGGSVRIPASVCGIYGLKATLGRIPHSQAPDLFANNSYIGPMTRTLDDLRLMYSVMAGETPHDPWSKALGTAPAHDDFVRVGFALKVGNPAVEPDVAASVEAAARALVDLGADVRPIDVDFAGYEPQLRTILETMLASRTADRVRSTPELFDPTFVKTVENGLARSGAEVQTAATVRSDLYRLVERHLGEVDYIVTPTLAAASVPADTDTHADIVIDGVDCGRIRAGWYPYTFPFNLTGHPALTMPCGWTGDGLPIGLQIVGRWYDEDGILDLAGKLAAVLGFELKMPSF